VKILLLLKFLCFGQNGPFRSDLFEEVFSGAVFGVLLGEFAADCGLEDRALDCFGELAV